MNEGGLLTGSFADKPFPVLLVEVKDAAKSGVLIAQKGEIVKRVFFRNGEPVVCRSNVKKELLGEILMRRGVLSRAQLDEAILESKKESIDNFGQILVRKGFISPQELYAKSKYQFISILFSLFAWEKGTYTFEDKEIDTTLPNSLPRFHLQFTKLISEGIRLLKKEDYVDRLLGDSGQVVQRSLLEIPSEEMSFKGQEQALLEAMGSGTSIQALADSGVLDPFMAKKVLYALSVLGTVVLQPPEDAEAALPAAALAGVAGEEALPSLEESSLSSMISEMQDDETDTEVSAEMPVTDDALEDLSVSQIADEALEADELLAPEAPAADEASAFHETTDKIDAAVAQAGEVLAGAPMPSSVEEVPPESPEEIFLTASAETESMQGEEVTEETFSAAAIDEALVSDSREEARTPSVGTVGEEVAVDEAVPPPPMEDELASLEAVPPGTVPEAPEAGEAEPVPSEQEAVAAETVSKATSDAAAKFDEEPPFKLKYRRSVRPARKGIPLLIGALVGGIVLLAGGMAFYFSQRSDRAATQTAETREQVQALMPAAETKTAAQIIEELAAEGVGKQPESGTDALKTGESQEPAATETAEKVAAGPGIEMAPSPEGTPLKGTGPETGAEPSPVGESVAGAGAEPAKADIDSEKAAAPAMETARATPDVPTESTIESAPVAKAVPSDAPEARTEAPAKVAPEVPPKELAGKPVPESGTGKESPPAPSPEGSAQQTVSAKVEAPAEAEPAETTASRSETAAVQAKPLQDWATYYDRGLASFKDGNLKTAFATWADVIRAAPAEAFSIQIELTSYLNYASKDLEAALPNEKVFIVLTSLNDKPVYKVLCGIYPDEKAAETALSVLSPYLKAQKPAVVSLVRLKEKLAKYQR